MRRKLLNIFASLSLLLCIAACVLWVRSHWRWDQLAWRIGDDYHMIESDRGRVVHYHIPAASPAAFHGGYRSGQWRPGFQPAPRVGLVGLGFEYYAGPYPWQPPAAKSITLHGAPHAVICIVTAVGGVPAVLSYVEIAGRRRRVLAGACPACGYDTRVTPDRCPECGKSPHSPPMQRSGAAGIVSFVRKLRGRGSAR